MSSEGQAKIVDVDGTRRRNTAGVEDFICADGPIRAGGHTVTLRHEPNDANPHAVAVYLEDLRHVGWIGTAWSEDSIELLWVKDFEEAGLRPQCRAECVHKQAGGITYTYLFFYMPPDDDLFDVSDELVARHSAS